MKSRVHIIDPDAPGGPWIVSYTIGKTTTCEAWPTQALARMREVEILEQFPDIEEAMRIKLLLAGTGESAEELIAAAAESHGLTPDTPFDQAADVHLAVVETRKVSAVTVENCRVRHRVMKAYFRDRPLGEIKPVDFALFLESRTGVDGGATSPATRRTYTGHMRAIMMAAGIANPLRGHRHIVPRGEVKYFSADNVRKMLEWLPSWQRGRFGLALFSGLPLRVAWALKETDVDYLNLRIHIRPEISLDGKEHWLEAEQILAHGRLIPGAHPLAFAWPQAFGLHDCEWRNTQVRLTAIMGFWIQDGLRRTFGTHYRALRTPGAAREVLSSVGEVVKVERFTAIGLTTEAKRFFSLNPASLQFRPQRARNGRIEHIPAEELERLLWTKPMPALARDLQVSLPGLFKRTRALGIRGPGPTYWGRKFAEERRLARARQAA